MAEKRKLPFGITSVKPSTMQTIADSKVAGFTIGSQKRSNPFQKHKEEAELKRRKEAKEAEKALEEFAASFEVDNSKSNKKFVKGKSTFVPTASVFGQDDEDDDNEAEKEAAAKAKAGNKPPGFVQASTTTASPATVTPAKSSGAKPSLGQDQEATPYVRDAKARRKAEMDAYLEELKRSQAERDERANNKQSRSGADDFKVGSRDTGDPNTTNLYIGNINPTVNEDQLCMEFAKYGPIASIKIMWPRTQEEIDRNRNCGFVSFMDRADAAVALKEMDGMELLGHAMKLGWGKAVALPAVPFFVHKDYKPPVKAVKLLVRKSIPPSSTDIIVTKPTDAQTVVVIHRVIEKVLINGFDFEEILIEKESQNPSFSFLVDVKTPEHIYYRWKLFSMMQGDTATRWRTEPFKMVDGGPVWVPPLMTFSDEIMEEDERLLEAQEEEFEKATVKGALSRGERGFFESQLRMMTSKRRSIGRAMMFCMQHADAADEIVEILVGSMVLSTTPQPVRMARLYLISDILHNCSVPLPNVWKFRSALEVKLPVMFEGLNGIYRQIGARLKADQFRRQIAGVLAVWENWIVFPQTFIDHLGAVLVRKETSGSTLTAGTGEGGHQTKTSSPTPSATASTTAQFGRLSAIEKVETEDDIDGEPMGDDEDLDGVPLDEDLDGVPMDDDDLDGVPL